LQLLEALAHLYSHNMVHQDLKPDNILVKNVSPFHFRLADFGLAKDKSTLKTLYGTEAYRVPEIFTARKYKWPVDI